MTEANYQSKIIKDIKKDGGIAINGNYTTNGECDLQCGIPYNGILIYCGIEVKTESDYHRVMSGIDSEYNVIDVKKLKKHEPLQMAKIRQTRKLGGLALVAFNYSQVMEYIDANKP